MNIHKHTQITLELANEQEYIAVRVGNNAAWMCPCGHRLPLIWSSFPKGKITVCEKCGKKYEGLYKLSKIKEIA